MTDAAKRLAFRFFHDRRGDALLHQALVALGAGTAAYALGSKAGAKIAVLFAQATSVLSF